MPCYVDPPSASAKRNQRVAQMLKYVNEEMKIAISRELEITASDADLAQTDYSTLLCEVLKSLPQEKRDELVYARNKTARMLADWWEDHLINDRRRESDVQDYQQRVIDEQRELALKLGKLKDFIDTEKFEALPEQERDLMIDQRDMMSKYLLILSQRIALFKDASET